MVKVREAGQIPFAGGALCLLKGARPNAADQRLVTGDVKSAAPLILKKDAAARACACSIES